MCDISDYDDVCMYVCSEAVQQTMVKRKKEKKFCQQRQDVSGAKQDSLSQILKREKNETHALRQAEAILYTLQLEQEMNQLEEVSVQQTH